MTQATDLRPAEAPVETDLAAEIHRILQASNEPLTVSKIRAHLPAHSRGISVEDLTEVLRRQVVANVLWQYPRYRSQQDRFWDRPMGVHVASLLRTTLAQEPLPWSELRRKLPGYAQPLAETVLQEQVAQGILFRHPRSGRTGERFGSRPADPKDYLKPELIGLFRRLEELGFRPEQVREAALELLHEEEWASALPGGPAHAPAAEAAPAPAAPPQAAPAAVTPSVESQAPPTEAPQEAASPSPHASAAEPPAPSPESAPAPEQPPGA